MLTIPKNPERFLFSVAALLLLLTVACSREESFLGTYQAIPGSPPEYADLVVELKKNGEGIRHFRGEALVFHWLIKGKEIRVQTKSGGIIVARHLGDLLEVEFPGPQIIHLKKIP
jgi:hypothetical protein